MVRFFVLPAPIAAVVDFIVPVLSIVVPPVFLAICIAGPNAESIVPLFVIV